MFIEDLPQILPTKFRFIWLSGFRGEDFLEINQSETRILPVAAMFVNGSQLNEHSLQKIFHRCFVPSFRSFGQGVSEEKIKTNRPIKNKNSMRRPFLLADQDQMCNLYRGPSIDASYQVSVHLSKWFQRRRLKCEKLTDDGRRTTDK